VPVPAGTRLQVQVHDSGAAWHVEDYGFESTPRLVGTARPVAAGSRTFAWRPRADLEIDGHDWRARLVRDGRPVTRWSRWGAFAVDPSFPRMKECRFTAGELRTAAEHAAARGWSLQRQLADDGWRLDLHRLAARLERAHPSAFVAADSVSAHRRTAWVAFFNRPPKEARAALARFERTHPGSEITVLTGRRYSTATLQQRADEILDAALDSGAVDPASADAHVDLRTGTITVSVANDPELHLTDAQIRARVRKAIADRFGGAGPAGAYVIVSAGPGVLAGQTRQPLRIEVRFGT
jgi:hypothetical protein